MSLLQQKPQATDLKQCLSELNTLLDGPLFTASDARQLHGKDTSFHEVHPPDAVTFVRSNEKVAEIVKRCVRYQIPMIPFGSGTSLEGYITVLYGGISLDLLRINKVIENNLDCRVQAGTTRKQLNNHLRSTNLLFPIPWCRRFNWWNDSNPDFRHQCGPPRNHA